MPLNKEQLESYITVFKDHYEASKKFVERYEQTVFELEEINIKSVLLAIQKEIEECFAITKKFGNVVVSYEHPKKVKIEFDQIINGKFYGIDEDYDGQYDDEIEKICEKYLKTYCFIPGYYYSK